MITRYEELNKVENQNMKGGDGVVKVTHFTDKEGLYNKGRMFAKVVLEPGCSIGNHDHQNEEEIYVITKGVAEYDDNGVITTLKEGDVSFCKHGEYHKISNRSNDTVEFVALILDK